jgi:mono/diheme cytochrome c family protein
MQRSFEVGARFAVVLSVLALAGCGSDDEGGGDPDVGEGPWDFGTVVPAEEQRPGDPERGYQALITEGYVSCGIPKSIFGLAFGNVTPDRKLEGREGANADLPFSWNGFTAKNGAELVVQNCLSCHASHFDGKLVVGLGDAFGDFTTNLGAGASAALGLIRDPEEKAEFEKFLGRATALAPNILTSTVGTNPADNIAAVLIAHRDRETLAWSDEPLLAIPDAVAPVDPPPWWRMKKKNAMFYNAAGRGDHARIMMSASALCTDSVEEARSIDAYFPDVRAYISSLEAPKYPFPIDQVLAAQGEKVFVKACAGCHGTYGESESYPNLLLPLDVVGTDPAIASETLNYASEHVDWYNESFYGEIARLELNEGYIAPPLDGVWASAPFLHNGSVPTIALLLDSERRPQFWTRSYDSTDFDQVELGFAYTVLDHGQDAEPDAAKKKLIYDTTRFAHSNLGHRFGDTLSDEERRSVLEYLKTL